MSTAQRQRHWLCGITPLGRLCFLEAHRLERRLYEMGTPVCWGQCCCCCASRERGLPGGWVNCWPWRMVLDRAVCSFLICGLGYLMIATAMRANRKIRNLPKASDLTEQTLSY